MPTHNISGYESLFLKTAKDHIDVIEKNLKTLTITHDKKVALEEIYRQAHSLKGSSTIMKYDTIAKVCERVIDIVHPQKDIKEIVDITPLQGLLQQLQIQIKEIEERKNAQHSI
jgi:chemotaxis protein histidine kinase CheA